MRSQECYKRYLDLERPIPCRPLTLLSQVGLLLPGIEQSVTQAYQIYSSRDEYFTKPRCGSPSCTTCGELVADAFKRSFCRDVHVHFVGVW